jgi:hypothetical protein
MRRLHRTFLLGALLLTTTATGRSLEELERALQRTPPVTTRFVEYRFSHLMKKPLRSSGTLEYRADGVLARHVETPYRESTQVEGDSVRITRVGRPERTLSLARAPQLRVLLGSFRALLEGRLAPLERDFEMTLEEQATHWKLTLKPRDARLAKHVERIDVFGSGDRPDCVEALEADGDGALTLLADEHGAATGSESMPRAELELLCRAPGAEAVQQ